MAVLPLHAQPGRAEAAAGARGLVQHVLDLDQVDARHRRDHQLGDAACRA